MIELDVYLSGEHIGTARTEVRTASFDYLEEYWTRRDATPLSLSLPPSRRPQTERSATAFFWGLLPDNPDTLRRWADEAHPRADEYNPLSLLSHYGLDCAGAVQFVRKGEPLPSDATPQEPLADSRIAAQLRALRRDAGAWVLDDDGGRFSLGGAQAKFALGFYDGSWEQPSQARPSTHILKPGVQEYDNNALNEHLTLQLASRLGLSSARTRVMAFEDQTAIVVDRFDRTVIDGQALRVHQEDLCQALAVVPAQKYEDQGGPGVRAIVELFRASQSRRSADRTAFRFLEAVFFNWLVLGPDAHAKNYSILLSGENIALAPLYDIASIAPYPDRYRPSTVKLAQMVNGKSTVASIGIDDWSAAARKSGLNPEEFEERVRAIVDDSLSALRDVCGEARAGGLDEGFITRYENTLGERFVAVRATLGRNAVAVLATQQDVSLHAVDLIERVSLVFSRVTSVLSEMAELMTARTEQLTRVTKDTGEQATTAQWVSEETARDLDAYSARLENQLRTLRADVSSLETFANEHSLPADVRTSIRDLGTMMGNAAPPTERGEDQLRTMGKSLPHLAVATTRLADAFASLRVLLASASASLTAPTGS